MTNRDTFARAAYEAMIGFDWTTWHRETLMAVLMTDVADRLGLLEDRGAMGPLPKRVDIEFVP